MKDPHRQTDLSPLCRAEQSGRRAAEWGFDWKTSTGALGKVQEELEELQELVSAGDDASKKRLTEEVGDLLFSVVNLARHTDVDPEQALIGAVDKFEARLARLHELAESRGQDPEQLTLDELEALWQRAKKASS